MRRVTAADAGKGLTRERDYRDVDGLITDEPGLVLSTFYADCVPLYVVDPVHLSLIHIFCMEQDSIWSVFRFFRIVRHQN